MLGDERADLVVLAQRLRLDRLALPVVPADESHPPQKVLGRIGDEVEAAVLLANLRGKHHIPPRGPM